MQEFKLSAGNKIELEYTIHYICEFSDAILDSGSK